MTAPHAQMLALGRELEAKFPAWLADTIRTAPAIKHSWNSHLTLAPTPS